MGKVIGSGLEAVKEFARRCLNAGGRPIVRTKYRGRRFPDNAVVVACWGKKDLVKGGTITGIPADVISKMETTKGDYKWLLGYT